tara:strand:- start:13226 stop:13372 length:147 start_codon:yes stop_codon:yes gene_type:complete
MSKLAYDVKYTAGSYLDAAISIPISTGRGISKLSEIVLGDRCPDFLNW